MAIYMKVNLKTIIFKDMEYILVQIIHIKEIGNKISLMEKAYLYGKMVEATKVIM